MRDFFQTPPKLGNQYEEDRVLKSYLEWKLPSSMLNEIQPELHHLGQRVIEDILKLGQEAEACPPRHIPYDPWGKRIDHIQVSPAWKELDKISAQEKLIAIGYERKHGAFSRIHQFAKLYLFHPSSAIYTCPLAMTDGAARALELHADESLKKHALPHLISSDPNFFWTSGQWMTERTGGSDVSGTSTIARPENSHFRLSGVKWFTSATTSQIAMTLARIEGAPEGSKGLSLFYLELRNQMGKLNGIRINRLKEKLGTRALPTAELTLENATALLVGEAGDGVKKISSLFNITRIYNACCAVGYMRRALALARDYATKRVAFGHTLSKHVLHLETLANMQMEFTAGFHLVFHAIELLGKDESGEATEKEQGVLRLLTPLVKLYTAKQAIALVSEALEAFGGAGYIEDTALPQLLRNAQVLSIWEGTTNILSLDALRAMHKENAAEFFLEDLYQRLGQINRKELIQSQVKVKAAIKKIKNHLISMPEMTNAAQQAGARQLAFALAQTYAASLLLEHAQWSLQNNKDILPVITANRWCEKNLPELVSFSKSYSNDSQILAMDYDEFHE
ncbi:acyl-CoA dehydrogenase family protein [Fluoribacter dumoffii]|uniref:acyl-CoA dehydrogenase family protein n=1 Tax=Fluoribacter dumoffii TaxID=463 RepID=UPI002244B1A8|nr:acyl-CoA dehydrogenase family protein [Fluoribacter dumoffii]MCW8419290.1 acyl-CoA dehydrogenase family protein [Fluoribacter dumoffii]MCW8452835.1 acyl-CoA dehydrogenase family protein [Fluoribacter dumoffii]MCW8459915.1 acyl-CoA dehydrogenase family protein [Fluoribacter dumoffii]MCW8483393.1 acyl-CoA dehydrogenase family protein [Fluoribacter dumoffii]